MPFSTDPIDADFLDFDPEAPDETPMPAPAGSPAAAPLPRIFSFPRQVAAPPLEEAKAGSKALTVWSPGQFLSYTPPVDSMLLGDGLVEAREWTSLVGIGGLGKSRVALWLCVCQITGREWCGLRTAGKPQRCLFLSTENGLRRWKVDLEKMFGGLTQDERAAVEAHLRILAITPDEEADLNLGDPGNVVRLIDTLRTETPGLIVFDPFADMVDGDENKTSDIVLTLRTLRQVHRTGAPDAAAVIVHHARTGAANVAQAGDNFSSGNFGRGSKALYSRVRCELQLAPGDRDDPNKIVLACGKANNSERFAPRGLIFNPETFAYAVDPSFNTENWRADVAGKRTGKTVSIVDVVRAVREKCPNVGDSVKAGEITAIVREATGAGLRTIGDRLREAVKGGYLKAGEKMGSYRLGAKPLPR